MTHNTASAVAAAAASDVPFATARVTATAAAGNGVEDNIAEESAWSSSELLGAATETIDETTGSASGGLEHVASEARGASVAEIVGAVVVASVVATVVAIVVTATASESASTPLSESLSASTLDTLVLRACLFSSIAA